MIVDSSAMLAVLLAEKDMQPFARAISSADPCRMSVVNYLEVAIRVDRLRNPVKSRQLDAFLTGTGLELVPATPAQAILARAAYQTYGKGSGHKAQLNLGDCFAYATAMDLGEPLLFKGNDFAKTDVITAL